VAEIEDDWTLFAEHRARLTETVVASATPAGRLCILGAGRCNDVDLDRLAPAARVESRADGVRSRPSMGIRLREVGLALALSLAVLPSVARADAELAVARSDDASGCPDAETMRSLVATGAGSSLRTPAHAYRVDFSRSDASYRAVIVDLTTGRTRRLDDTGLGCGPLGQATAQVVATMWSSERDEPESSPPAVAPPKAEEPRPVTRPERSARWILGAGPMFAFAIVRPAALALGGAGGVELDHVSVGLGALWIPPQRIDVAPGSIDVDLVAGSAWGCVFRGDETRIGLCGRLFAGALQGEGSGFTSNEQRVRPWFAIEPELNAEHVFGWLRGRAAAGAVVPLHAETFSITGAGAAYATPVVGGLASLSLMIATP
jgi:hypothetical protein